MADIPIPLVGASNEGIHPKADCQKTVNFYPVRIEAEGEKAPWHLQGTPGLLEFCELPKRPIRGSYVYEGRLFVVAGSTVYEVRENGTTKSWGALASVAGRVTIAELNDIIVIGDGATFYALNLAASTLTAIAGAPVGRVCFTLDQRMFYVERGNTAAPGQVFYSELLDPTNIPALNFFTAENKPDAIVTGIATEDRIFLGGDDTLEPWYDAGDNEDPFQRVPGGVIHSGVLAADTMLYVDNTLWYVEKDANGKGIVRRVQGSTPLRISTAAVERFTATATNLTAFSYQEQGKTFYVLNANEGTWAFEIASGKWHQRSWLNTATSEEERARPEIHAFAYGKHIVSDYTSGKLYEMSLSLYDDDGNPIRRSRVTGHVDLAGSNVTVDELYIDVATGVGLATGQGSDPQLMMRYSRDGGLNWSNELTRSLGPIGKTQTRVRFCRLGAGRDWAFEIAVSDPVQCVITGAWARVRRGQR